MCAGESVSRACLTQGEAGIRNPSRNQWGRCSACHVQEFKQWGISEALCGERANPGRASGHVVAEPWAGRPRKTKRMAGGHVDSGALFPGRGSNAHSPADLVLRLTALRASDSFTHD